MVENIIEVHAADEAAGATMTFRVAIRNQAQFEAMLRAVKEIPMVKQAERYFPEN
jgi:2-methylisocitrate lyase-like PEP mutase family enzyme